MLWDCIQSIHKTWESSIVHQTFGAFCVVVRMFNDVSINISFCSMGIWYRLLADLASLNDHNVFWLAIGRTCCSSPIHRNQLKVRVKKNISFLDPLQSFSGVLLPCILSLVGLFLHSSKIRSYHFNWSIPSLRAKFIHLKGDKVQFPASKSLVYQIHPQISIDFSFQPSLVANGIWQLHRHHLNKGMDL